MLPKKISHLLKISIGGYFGALNLMLSRIKGSPLWKKVDFFIIMAEYTLIKPFSSFTGWSFWFQVRESGANEKYKEWFEQTEKKITELQSANQLL